MLLHGFGAQQVAGFQQTQPGLCQGLQRLHGAERAQHGLLEGGGAGAGAVQHGATFGELGAVQRGQRADDQEQAQQQPAAIGNQDRAVEALKEMAEKRLQSVAPREGWSCRVGCHTRRRDRMVASFSS